MCIGVDLTEPRAVEIERGDQCAVTPEAPDRGRADAGSGPGDEHPLRRIDHGTSHPSAVQAGGTYASTTASAPGTDFNRSGSTSW